MKIHTDLKSAIQTLHVTENQPAICPYKPMLLHQSQLGGMQQLPQTCNSLCPHFEFKEGTLNLSCGSVVRLIKTV